MKYLFVIKLLSLVTILFSCHGQDHLPGPKDATFMQMDSVVQQFMSEYHIMGGAVAIVKDDRLVYSRTFGIDERGAEIQRNQLFKIASLSKPLTAIAIMELVEKGKLELDRKVFGPEGILNDQRFSQINDERIYSITVRHLLEHSAGWDRDINPHGDPMFHPFYIACKLQIKGPADKIEIIQYMLSQSLDFSPGKRFAYSNLGYNILGRIIEKITGNSYGEYMQQNVFRPVGIVDMQLAMNSDYPFTKNNDDSFINIESMDAHGGWKASAEDMVKLLNAIDVKHYGLILTQKSIATMLQASGINSNYGMGWFVNEKGNIWHTGSLNGCSSFMAKLTNGLDVVFLFNDRSDDPDFFPKMDQLIWQGTRNIKVWPQVDLFQAEKVSSIH